MTIPANLDLTEVLAIFKERIETELALGALESFDAEHLKALEEKIRAFGLEVIGHCIALLLYTLSQHAEADRVSQAATAHGRGFRCQSQGRRAFKVTTVSNVCVELWVTYLLKRPLRHKRGKSKPKREPGQRGQAKSQGYYPFARWLSLEEGMTPMVWTMVAEVGLMGSSFAAANHQLKDWGIRLSEQRLARLTYRFSRIGMALTVQDMERVTLGTLPVGETFRGQRVVVELDGGRTRIREENFGRPRKSGYHGYKGPWREPKLITIFAVDDQGNRIRTLELPVINDGSFSELEDFLTLLKMYLVKFGVQHAKEVLLICDGATWMWNRVPALLKDIGLGADQILQLIDFYHGAEHLQEFADLAFDDATEASRWFHSVRSKLRNKSITAALKAIHAQLKQLPPDQKPAAQKAIDFFEKQPERFHYACIKKLNWPIGSGAIESLIRQVVNLRVKGNGKFWLLHNAEWMIHGRCQWVAGQWDAFTKRVLTIGTNQDLSPDFYTKLAVAA